jgi:hypothetical protein
MLDSASRACVAACWIWAKESVGGIGCPTLVYVVVVVVLGVYDRMAADGGDIVCRRRGRGGSS